jgi:hypothetical protein
MGSSGMKRKGRRHLPKVGTRPQMEQELDDRRQMALHPFSAEPLPRRGAGYGIVAGIVAMVVAIGVVALIVAT